MSYPTGGPSARRPVNPLALVLILSGVFFVLFLLLSGGLFLMKGKGSGGKSGVGQALFSGGSVGVVEVTGIILDSKKTLKRLERFAEDGDIKAIVIRLNSPGGAVAPSQEIYEAVKDFKKPIVVSMGSVAASGAYYIACGAKKVFANPGTITGSIGVIMEFANLKKLYEWAKIQRYTIKTGRYKDAGADHRDMTDDERALLQAMVDDVLGQFKAAVSEGRNLSLPQVTAVADGRIFSGRQAKTAKLVDELGTMQDAIDEAAKLGKIKGKPTVVYPARRKGRLIDVLLDDRSGDDGEFETEGEASGFLTRLARRLLDGTSVESVGTAVLSPGIYWLWTGLK